MSADGLGHSGTMQARYHEWDPAKHPDGIGAVVGYRICQRGEQVDLDTRRQRWPEKARRS